MQQMWTDIDQYIDSHLIPEDPRLEYALKNTDEHGFSNHLAVAPNQGMFLQMLIQMNKCKRVLEIGTFAAYSTIWLGRALPEDVTHHRRPCYSRRNGTEKYRSCQSSCKS